MIEGINPDAEIVTNSNGGKQSKAIGAFHLVDPDFMYGFFNTYFIEAAIICDYMNGNTSKEEMVKRLLDHFDDALILIAKTMEYGASRYKPNNWRLIPEEDHINHALIHLYAMDQGDTQDDHKGHFLTRIMMAYATKKSRGFDYTRYIDEVN